MPHCPIFPLLLLPTQNCSPLLPISFASTSTPAPKGLFLLPPTLYLQYRNKSDSQRRSFLKKMSCLNSFGPAAIFLFFVPHFLDSVARTGTIYGGEGRCSLRPCPQDRRDGACQTRARWFGMRVAQARVDTWGSPGECKRSAGRALDGAREPGFKF